MANPVDGIQGILHRKHQDADIVEQVCMGREIVGRGCLYSLSNRVNERQKRRLALRA